MAVQLDCPSCGASVKARRGVVSVTCQYCGNSVMVPKHLAGVSGVPGSGIVWGRSMLSDLSTQQYLSSILKVVLLTDSVMKNSS